METGSTCTRENAKVFRTWPGKSKFAWKRWKRSVFRLKQEEEPARVKSTYRVAQTPVLVAETIIASAYLVGQFIDNQQEERAAKRRRWCSVLRDLDNVGLDTIDRTSVPLSSSLTNVLFPMKDVILPKPVDLRVKGS